MFSSTPPSTPMPSPAAILICVKQNSTHTVLLCNAQHYNSFCLFLNKLKAISLYLLSEHASFFLISPSVDRFFRGDFQTNVLFVVARLWGNRKRSGLSLRQRRKNNTIIGWEKVEKLSTTSLNIFLFYFPDCQWSIRGQHWVVLEWTYFSFHPSDLMEKKSSTTLTIYRSHRSRATNCHILSSTLWCLAWDLGKEHKQTCVKQWNSKGDSTPIWKALTNQNVEFALGGQSFFC